jgi:uncharacterized BrkB/YihY/UPF0761 family membrane protein
LARLSHRERQRSAWPARIPTVSSGRGRAHWAAALALVALVVTLLLRFAPAQRPNTGWAGAGAALIAISWVFVSAAVFLVGAQLDERCGKTGSA